MVGSGEGGSPDECGTGSLELGGGSSNSSTSSNPSDWAISLDRLLADPAGVSVYTLFLEEELGCRKSLDFFFACKGLGMQSPENLCQLLPLIWKNFIRKHDVQVNPKTYAILAQKIHENSLSADMFQVAQREVFEHMMNTTYLAFLQSQHYIDQQKLFHQESKQDSVKNEERKKGYQSSYHMQTRMQDVLLREVDYSHHLYAKKQLSSLESSSRPGESHYSHNQGPYSAKTEEEFNLSAPLNSGNWTGITQGSAILSTVYENEATTPASAGGESNAPSQGLNTDQLALGARLAMSLRVVDRQEEAEDNSSGVVKKRLNLTLGALAATMGHRAAPLPRPRLVIRLFYEKL